VPRGGLAADAGAAAALERAVGTGGAVMNCKPKQRAWIDVPRTPLTIALGMDQIDGHVVETQCVHPGSPAGDPQWIVEPPQSIKVPRDVRARNATVAAGTIFRFEGIPDSYLRPFEDFPPEELEQLQRELTS
jgi:hypothetical protein